MKSLIIYESMYGNTRKIAEAIAKGMRSAGVGSTETSGGNPAVVEVVPASNSDACEAGTTSWCLLRTRPSSTLLPTTSWWSAARPKYTV